MNHIFEAKKFEKLESPERYKLLPPELVLSHLHLNTGCTIADVGCAIGYFSFPFADHVGNSGKVIATDISEIMVDELNNRVTNRQYTNIEVIRSTPSDLCVPLSSVDIFFTSTLIHEIDNLVAFTSGALQTIKKGGRLAYLDFEKKETGSGPPVDKRISADYCYELFNTLGLRDLEKHMIGDVFYLVIGTKPL